MGWRCQSSHLRGSSTQPCTGTGWQSRNRPDSSSQRSCTGWRCRWTIRLGSSSRPCKSSRSRPTCPPDSSSQQGRPWSCWRQPDSRSRRGTGWPSRNWCRSGSSSPRGTLAGRKGAHVTVSVPTSSRRWLRRRRTVGGAGRGTRQTIVPSRADVLRGRGGARRAVISGVARCRAQTHTDQICQSARWRDSGACGGATQETYGSSCRLWHRPSSSIRQCKLTQHGHKNREGFFSVDATQTRTNMRAYRSASRMSCQPGRNNRPSCMLRVDGGWTPRNKLV